MKSRSTTNPSMMRTLGLRQRFFARVACLRFVVMGLLGASARATRASGRRRDRAKTALAFGLEEIVARVAEVLFEEEFVLQPLGRAAFHERVGVHVNRSVVR